MIDHIANGLGPAHRAEQLPAQTVSYLLDGLVSDDVGVVNNWDGWRRQVCLGECLGEFFRCRLHQIAVRRHADTEQQCTSGTGTCRQLRCTFDSCTQTVCFSIAAAYGDLAGAGGTCGPDDQVDIFDIFAVLDGFQDSFADGCTPSNIDIAAAGGTCGSDGQIDIFDIFAVLDAFQGVSACCG